jgi:hypothetical protein
MKGFIRFLAVMLLVAPIVADARNVVSRAARITNTPTSGYTYNYMYPYMNNQMRNTLNPGDANAQSTSPINAVVKTAPLPDNQSRRVVARSAKTTTTSGRVGTSAARSATRGYASASIPRESNRQVASRGVVARSGRTSGTATGSVATSTSGSYYSSSSRCLADYTECMNNYCVRNDTPYNRCFCSSKLSQIESTYEPSIDSLVKRIIRAKDTSTWTDAEMSEYWNEKIGQYVGENTWEKLDDALNIDWPNADLRMQGQNAYLTGHQYCINHLKNCAYAAPNMRDVYRSEIARDCAAYEKSLDKLKTALEMALETYQN